MLKTSYECGGAIFFTGSDIIGIYRAIMSHGDVALLCWFDKLSKYSWETFHSNILHMFYVEIAENGCDKLLSWILEKQKPKQSDLVDILLLAGRCGHICIVKILHSYGVEWPTNFMCVLVEANQLDILRWVLTCFRES